MKLSVALVPCLLLVAALWATQALVEARRDQPLDVKLRACVELAKQPGVTDRHPLTACINLATADYRLLHQDWHQFYVTCVTNKGTAEPSIYENWASQTADCVDHWLDLP